MPGWLTDHILVFDFRALPKHQSARKSKIKKWSVSQLGIESLSKMSQFWNSGQNGLIQHCTESLLRGAFCVLSTDDWRHIVATAQRDYRDVLVV